MFISSTDVYHGMPSPLSVVSILSLSFEKGLCITKSALGEYWLATFVANNFMADCSMLKVYQDWPVVTPMFICPSQE